MAPNMSAIGRVLGHAFVVAVAVGVLAIGGTLGGAYIARQWQERDNDVRTKDVIVERMSGAVGDFLGAVRIHGRGREADRTLDTSFAEWEAESSAVGAQLAAYFPSSGAADRWRDYRTMMTFVYYVLRRPDEQGRRKFLHKVNDALAPPHQRDGNFQVLNGLLAPVQTGSAIGSPYENARRALILQLGQRADRIVTQVLDARSIYD